MSDLGKARIDQLDAWARKGTNDATPGEIRQLIAALADAREKDVELVLSHADLLLEHEKAREEIARLRRENLRLQDEYHKLMGSKLSTTQYPGGSSGG